jgi:hypothetical protein
MAMLLKLLVNGFLVRLRPLPHPSGLDGLGPKQLGFQFLIAQAFRHGPADPGRLRPFQILVNRGEHSLKRALHHYEMHYHQERNHQGKDNLLLFPLPPRPSVRNCQKLRCRQRLGGLLKYYELEAA